jgi:hypothetical protein
MARRLLLRAGWGLSGHVERVTPLQTSAVSRSRAVSGAGAAISHARFPLQKTKGFFLVAGAGRAKGKKFLVGRNLQGMRVGR